MEIGTASFRTLALRENSGDPCPAGLEPVYPDRFFELSDVAQVKPLGRTVLSAEGQNLSFYSGWD
jgi:hypothetical protein